jgi:hypothetical protein
MIYSLNVLESMFSMLLFNMGDSRIRTMYSIRNHQLPGYILSNRVRKLNPSELNGGIAREIK